MSRPTAAALLGLALLAVLVGAAPVRSQEPGIEWIPEGRLGAEGDPEYQPIAALAATPWLNAEQSDGIAYFAFEAPARIERYDMVAETWLASIVLPEAPTAFHVDGDGIYVSFGRRTSRFSLDGAAETHLANTNYDVGELETIGDALYAQDGAWFYSFDKWDGTPLDTADFFYSLIGVSAAPSQLRLFGRSTGVSPSDIVSVRVGADGTFVGQEDSPYHGDYPSAAKTWIYPGEALVVDNAGIVYHTGDLRFAGSLAGGFDDVAFDGLTAIVLRSGVLVAYSQGFRRVGEYTPARAPSGIFTEGDAVFAFSWDGAEIGVEKVLLSLLSVPEPGAPVDPHGLTYTPDEVVFDGEDVLYLLHRGSLSVFRWSLEARDYLETIPLVQGPTHMALSTVNGVLYFTYPGGEITEVPLATLRETPLVNSPQSPCGLATAGEYVFVCDPSGAWVSHFTYRPDGTLVSQVEWNYFSLEYVWSEANRRMYFFRDDTSPNDLIWEQILADGSIGSERDSPYHSSAGILHPIRVAPDGSLVILGSGRIYDALSLAQVNTLSNDVADALWSDGKLVTLRPWGEQSQAQKWTASYGVDLVRELPGTPLGLFTDGDSLLVATLVDGAPEIAVLDFQLRAPGFVVRKSDGLGFARPGQAIEYRIEVTNASSAMITGAAVVDSLPPALVDATWTCAASPGSTCTGGLQQGAVSDVVSVKAGGTIVYTQWARIDPSTPDSILTNVATVQETTGATARSVDRTLVRSGLISSDDFESGNLSLWIDHGD